MWLASNQRVGTDESTTQQVVDLVMSAVTTRPMPAGQTVMTVSRNCRATYVDMRMNYRCTETQIGGNANGLVQHLQTDTGQWKGFKPDTGTWRTCSEPANSINRLSGSLEQYVCLHLAAWVVPGTIMLM
jgi:hypothetical protein